MILLATKTNSKPKKNIRKKIGEIQGFLQDLLAYKNQ